MKYLYFTAGWCGPCNMLGPIMEKVKNTGIPVQKIDVDTANPLIAEMGIRNVPTVILVSKTNEEYARMVGVQPESKYISTYKEFNQ
jgi:thioredoxin 1